MEVYLLVTASVAVLTGLVGLAHGLLPRRRRPRTTEWSSQPPRHRTAPGASGDERRGGAGPVR
jgi:hypothetical protein